MIEAENQLPILENGFDKWKNNEIDYRGRQVVQIGDNRFNRLSNECWQQIKAAQQEYIDHATKTFFQKLKNRFDVEPKEYQKATKDTVLWILSNAVVEPTHKILWLPYATFQQQNAFDKTFGTHTPNLTSIRACYLDRQNVDVSWVSPQALECQIINPQTAMLGYVRFLEYLEKPAPPAVVEVKVLPAVDTVKVKNIRGKYPTSQGNKDAVIAKFKALLVTKIETEFKNNRKAGQGKIISKSFKELKNQTSTNIKTLYSYLPKQTKTEIYEKAFSQIQNKFLGTNYNKIK